MVFGEDVTPDVTVYGSGDPELAVVASVHGDEPTGARAIHSLLDSSPDIQRAVKFIVANPPAAVAHRRALDDDMNRNFPGNPDSDSRERRLASHLVEETEDCAVLSFHTTHATTEPLAFITGNKPRALSVASKLPLKYVVNETATVDSAFSSTDGVVSVETGKPEHADATEKAETILRAFLQNEGALDGDTDSDVRPHYYETTATVAKPPDADSYELFAENFERVSEGSKYAKIGDETLVADESFVPILLSESGYDEIFGFRGEKTAETVDGARDAWLSESREKD